MLRALRVLPGGLGRFIPCRIGANHCRLRAVGWERCCHGITSRPLEASAPRVLGSLLTLFGYPVGSEAALCAGRLRMRYCDFSFANKKLTWGLPRDVKIAHLLLHEPGNGEVGNALPSRPGSLEFRLEQDRVFPKRIRLNKKTPVRDIQFVYRGQPIPRRWKRLRDPEHDRVDGDAGKRRLSSWVDFRKGIG